MTLKEILEKHGKTDYYRPDELRQDLEKLIEEAYKKACIDNADFYFEEDIEDRWQSNKSKFLG